MAVVSTPVPAGIFIWETHNQAHLEFLPVDQIEDQSVVFSSGATSRTDARDMPAHLQ